MRLRYSGVRSVQFANHQRQQPSHFVRRSSAGNSWRVFGSNRSPIDAVQIRVKEVIPQVRPRLIEDLGLLAREVDIHLGGDRKRSRIASLERHSVDATLHQVKHLFAVGRELRVAFEARRRCQLPRDCRLTRKFIKRVDVQVLLACSACAGDYEDPDRTAWSDEEQGDAEGDVDDPASANQEVAAPRVNGNSPG